MCSPPLCRKQSGTGKHRMDGVIGMRERLERLLCVKSIVTIFLTVIFAILAIRRVVSADQFITIFTVVVSFYFGTQHERMGEQ